VSRDNYGVSDWLRAAANTQREIEIQRREIAQRRHILKQARSWARDRLATAANELGAGLLPVLTDEAVLAGMNRSGYLGLSIKNPVKLRDQERVRLQQRIAQIEADPAYVNREELRDPDVGSLTRELTEAKADLAPVASIMRRAQHPRLPTLLRNGYGTRAYQTPWWRLSYYTDWEAGDEILAKFDEFDEDFGRWIDHYEQAKRAYGTLKENADELQAEWDRGEALVEEHAEAHRLLLTLDERHLASARERTLDFLRDAGPVAFANRLDDLPELALLAKRWSGLVHQLLYLEELEPALLDGFERDLNAQSRKLDRKAMKYRRPKKRYTRFTSSEFNRTFKDRSDKYAKRWKRFDRSYEAVTTFDHYDRCQFTDDYLWWDELTDGKVNGNFMPHVQRHRHAHPSYHYTRWRDRPRDDRYDDEQAAAAVAYADQRDDDLHSYDAS
jgi:hypothetical protein